MTPTIYQISLLQHTIGVRPDHRNSHRNHFVAGPGHHDMPHLEALVASGLMEIRRAPAFLDDGDVVFAVTEAGQSTALESLPPSPKRTRYEKFLDADCDETFGEFLCGHHLPRFESREARGSLGVHHGLQPVFAGYQRRNRRRKFAGVGADICPAASAK